MTGLLIVLLVGGLALYFFAVIIWGAAHELAATMVSCILAAMALGVVGMTALASTLA